MIIIYFFIRLTYAVREFDEETGLYYLNARHYDPVTARFLSEDTYYGQPNDPLSLNLYTYGYNNPLIYYDPTGHWPQWVDNTKQGIKFVFKSKEEQEQEILNVIQYGSEKDLLVAQVGYTAGVTFGGTATALSSYAAVTYGVPAIASSSVGTTISTAVTSAGTAIANNSQRLMPIVNNVATKVTTTGTNVVTKLTNLVTKASTSNIGNTVITKSDKIISQADVGYNAGVTLKDTVQGNWGNLGEDLLYLADSIVNERYNAGGMSGKKNSQPSLGLTNKGYKPQAGERSMTKAEWKSYSVSLRTNKFPKGATYQGSLYRNVGTMPDGTPVNPLDMSDYTKAQNYRYTEPGVNGIYFGSNKHIVDSEIRSYDVNPNASNRTTYKYNNVKLENMLDLTNPSVRKELGINLSNLLSNSYKKPQSIGNATTHKVGRLALENGYTGILTPSARGDGGINVVLFNPEKLK